MNSADDLYRAARALAKSGQPVFPCKAHGEKAKAPLTRNGLHDATTSKAQIKDWWRRYGAKAAIGIPTGVVWDVLDVDSKGEHDGRQHLTGLTELGLLNGCKKVVRTPSGGWHLYFKTAPGLTNKARAHLGLDVRSLGGYVLAPPSFLETDDYAGPYEDIGATEGSTDDPLWWDLIVSNIAPIDTTTNKPIDLLPSERRASVASLREWLSIRAMGERNNALHWAVCRCIENNIDPNELMDAALLTGLDETEVDQTINSALRRAGVRAADMHSEAEAMFGAD